MKVGILGLGNMGAGMASTLLKKSFDVYGFDLNPAARHKATENGIKTTQNLSELLSQIEVLILSLPKAEHVEAVCLGENGVLTHAISDLIVIDTTTSTPETSRKVAQALQQKGIQFIDAPVSGGPIGAATGTMTMVVGADETVFQQVQPILQAMSKTQVHVGDVGSGNVVKIANNLLAAAHLITTAEAVSLAHHAGVSPEKLLEGINAGSGRSAVSEVSFPKWILNQRYDSGFTMGLMRKDVGLAQSLADQLDLNLPLSQQIIQMWQDSKQLIADSEDFNCIVKQTDAALFSHQENENDQ
ncbi:NAD(P)-dependent oxidoreductase [Acinetobacter sp. MB5]|uniref:NAD(P)-dependent oxidoreductase n=1 Tax=Acinetobacter sp. MB5 TaxID=2069438 RepID=UPI000DD0C05F|nr:NAD(P)-dependent oxidoreductase [Acinetobacter sp. MB5]